MPKNYDQIRDFRELENKDLQKEDIEQIRNELEDRRFLNQVWWKDLLIGLAGIALLIIANRLFIESNRYPENPGRFRMLWAILQPIGLIVGVRVLVAVSKIIKIFKSR